MTGPEHYAAAERDLEKAYADTNGKSERFHLDAALIHATLANAAAAIDATEIKADWLPPKISDDWNRVTQ